MKFDTLRRWASTAFATIALAACGGGGGASGGIDGTGNNDSVAYGAITAFGSVWVNGVEYSTDGATIKIDDSNVGQSALRVGMVVRVDGSISDRRAGTIVVDDAVKGRVEQSSATQLTVMGQVVAIDSQTRLENGVLPGVGDYVEVHGQAAGDGLISAGFIERKTTLAVPPFVVKGFVKNHDAAASTFQVGTLTVSYTGATTGDMPAGSWNGMLVDAKGSTCAGSPVCGTLQASKVEPGGPNVASIAKAEVEGFVSALTANGFVVAGQTVVTTGSTVFEGGTAAEIFVGSKVEAEGPISNGVLTATKVSLRESIRFEADVSSVDAAAGTLTLAGLPGITVQVNALTELDGVGSLAGLAAPNHVRVRGRPGQGNVVVASELEVRSASSDPRVELRGPVSAVSGTTSVTILGVVVNTSGVADNEFKDDNDVPIGRSAFFAALSTGRIVKARGDLAGNSVDWDEMELED